jgi:uncharacterized protein HemY
MAKATLESASRRSVVKSAGAALAALTFPATAIAAMAPDPIVELIEAAKAAQQAYTDCFDEANRLHAALRRPCATVHARLKRCAASLARNARHDSRPGSLRA